MMESNFVFELQVSLAQPSNTSLVDETDPRMPRLARSYSRFIKLTIFILISVFPICGMVVFKNTNVVYNELFNSVDGKDCLEGTRQTI